MGHVMNKKELHLFPKGMEEWMTAATGSPLTVEPMLEAVREIIK